MSSILTQALSPAVMLAKLPKCVVSIYVVVLESDGGELAAAINCASLALIDAAVEMYDIVTASEAVCCCVHPQVRPFFIRREDVLD